VRHYPFRMFVSDTVCPPVFLTKENLMLKYQGLTADQWSWFYCLDPCGRLLHSPERPDHTFATEAAYKRFYTMYAGTPVSSKPDYCGYALCRPTVDGKKVVGMRHLVVWFLHHGWLPAKGHRVTHLDGDRLNDQPTNLALLDRREPNPSNVIYSFQKQRLTNANISHLLLA